jgi:vacuolar iron transporter family protein
MSPEADVPPSATQVEAAESGRATHPRELHSQGTMARLNWLRAGVLGANDGIVSVAAIVIGVAGATASRGAIFTAGLAGLVGGAVSMALGEYVSVSSQRDSERAAIRQETRELADDPDAELTELTALYEAKGLSAATARSVATELSARNALDAHLDAELHIDPADLASPIQAAGASALSFVSGGLLPMLAILLPAAGARVWVTFVAVLAALALTGALSAHLGASDVRRAVIRVVVGGALVWPSPTSSGTCSAQPSAEKRRASNVSRRAPRAGRPRRSRRRALCARARRRPATRARSAPGPAAGSDGTRSGRRRGARRCAGSRGTRGANTGTRSRRFERHWVRPAKKWGGGGRGRDGGDRRARGAARRTPARP